MSELVSVVMPSYQSAKFIRQSILSVLRQTYENFELIIVDNPSTDGTTHLIREIAIKDKRIRHLIVSSNLGGAAQTRNHGIAHARGRFLAFIDSDDNWMPSKLQNQVDLLLSTNTGFSYTGYRVIDEKNNIILGSEKIPALISYTDLLKQTIIVTSTVMIDFNRFNDFAFPVGLPLSEDYPAWLNVLRVSKQASGLSEVLSEYRIVENSLSSKKIKSTMVVWNTYRYQEALPLFLSLYYFANYITYAFLKNRRFKRKLFFKYF